VAQMSVRVSAECFCEVDRRDSSETFCIALFVQFLVSYWTLHVFWWFCLVLPSENTFWEQICSCCI